MAGGTVGNYRFEYAIDKNDGNGWSTLTSSSYTAATLATAMNAITGIDASLGFKLRLKITTGTANTTAITSFYMLTTSTTTTQAYQYPLDSNTVTITGIVAGSDVTFLTSGTETVLQNSEDIAGTANSYIYSGAQTVDITIYKPGYIPYFVRNLSLGTTDSSLPVSQTADPSYLV